MPPPEPYLELDPNLPIVLMPVRLETRYFAVDDSNVELRVRIFPSSAQVTTDRPGIDPAERDETVAYWQTRKAAGDTASATTAAWQRMVQLFGDPRARWLRQVLTPSIAADGALVFPEVTINQPSDAASLTSQATALPTRFFVSGYVGERLQFQTAGKTVPASVTVGPHGAAADILWQTDFNTAEGIGLAVRIKIAKQQAAALTRLLVFGLREGPDEAGSQSAFDTLIERHTRSVGVALLAPGTPTNNTAEARVDALPSSSGATPAANSDGARMATALGMDAADFAAIGATEAATDSMVGSMHTALWPLTLGYFLEQVMSPVFAPEAVARARSLFQAFVRPGGPFLTLAIGSQPYGVLPVSSIARWRSGASAVDPLAQALSAMRADWLAAAAKLPRLGAGTDPGADLTAILSLSPISVRWTARTLESIVTAQRAFESVDASHFQSVVDRFRSQRAASELTPLGITGSPRALDFFFDANNFDLNVPLVASADIAKNAPLPVNYIQAMASAGLDALKNNAVDGASPRSLLYLLLRHATLLAMTRTAGNFPTVLGARREEAVFIEKTEDTTWAQLQIPVPALANRTLSDIFASPTLPGHPGFADLAQHRGSLHAISTATVGELERLTAGTLDACSHRLEAWITALAGERLASMRVASPRASHLGAYAWVDAPPIPSALPRDGDAAANDPVSEGFIHAPGLAHARTAAVLRSAFVTRANEGSEAQLAIDLSSDRVRAARWLMDSVRGGANLSTLLGERIERWMIELGLGPQLESVRGQFPLNDGSGRARIDGLLAAQTFKAHPPSGALAAIAERLDQLTDAVGDLLLAEAVHHQVSGRPNLAQAALSGLDTGVSLPSDFEVVRTDSDSTTRAWHIILPLAPDQVNAWAAGLIGESSRWSASVRSASGGAATTITYAQLNVAPQTLLDFVKTGPSAPALAGLFEQAAGGGIATFSAELQAALRVADAISRLLRSAKPLEDSDVGTGRDAIPELAQRSRQTEWLHDLGRARPCIDALDSLAYIARANGIDLKLRFLASGPRLNLLSIGDLPAAGVTTGLILDAWNDTTPGTETVTGIAMHYDAPRSRAPQALLLMVPPDPAARWSADTVAAILLETADLTQIRMVRPADVHGSFLPAIYIADNLAAETVSTDFFPFAYVTEWKDANS